MTEEIDPAVIKKTQDILGSVIRKPALTEKSLKKPPFRFLHDIITNVIKTSGFLKGLYTPEELQSDNVKDKDSKILFLQKAIDVLAIATNQPVNLKPSKVVAGHDPQKTNLFLQIIGTAAKNKVDSKEAVEKVLSGKLQTSPTKAPKDRRASIDRRSKGANEKSHSRSLTKTLDPVKKSSSSQNKESSGSKSNKDVEKVKSKDRREKSKDRSKPKDETKKPSKERSPKKKVEEPDVLVGVEVNGENSENVGPAETAAEGVAEMMMMMQPEPSTSMMNGSAHEKEDLGENEGGDSNKEMPPREKSHRPHSSRSGRPPSARSKRTKPSDLDSPSDVPLPREPMVASHSIAVPTVPEQTFENTLMPSFRPPSTRPPSARPSSSRPAPPRIRIKHVVENEEPALRPTTAKPVENVILDQSQPSDDEEEAFLVMESEATENLEIPQTAKSLPAETPDEDKGSLVKKLLETKKDLEGGSQHTPTKKAEIDPLASHRLEHERNSASKELSALRGWVQSLSRSAVPLGRMLDFLQEDVDAMRMELGAWREEHRANLTQLRKEQSATESLLEPLRAQLDDLDQVVQNQLDANSALKASIAKNDERIQRMLNSVNHKS